MEYDPTRTKVLIRSFEREYTKRINRFWRNVYKPLFGLIRSNRKRVNQQEGKTRIVDSALSDIERLLNEYEYSEVLREMRPVTRKYLEESYKKGASKASSQLGNIGLPVSFQGLMPLDYEAMDVLVDNGFSLVKNASNDLKKELLRNISTGMLEGWNPRKMGRELRKNVKMSRHRAEMICRTETIRSYAQGSVNQYKKAGVHYWEWIASYDERTCPVCSSLDGKVFRVGEPQPPIHPNCRCSVAPRLKK
jgi:SPP1 gp7 family putative phage head morphogenesis protein